jgi:hypothetical protein
MPHVYIEGRPKGRREGSPVDEFVVEDQRGPHARRLQDAARSDRVGASATTPLVTRAAISTTRAPTTSVRRIARGELVSFQSVSLLAGLKGPFLGA